MIEKRILIVDDEPGALLILDRSLTPHGYTVVKAESGEIALDLFRDNPFPVVVTDINMPGMSGLDLLREVMKMNSDARVLMMTAYADLDSAIEALRSGAYDYIVKPFKPDLMVRSIERAFENLILSDEVRYLKSQIENQYGFESIIGVSPTIRNIIRMAHRIAPSEESVLITGASGTGKELFARAIHLSSPRKDNRFIAVNCGSLPEQLMESELFGHKKGAFTGAAVDKIGLIQEAEGGTIFLDEVAELPSAMQVKLLRFLQDHNIRPVGSVKENHVDVRVIAATNRLLEEEVAAGKFREDLFYRLRVLVIDIPPLAQRPEDVSVLIEHFLEKFAKQSGRPVLKMSEAVKERLARYDWPGNIREVENLVKHLMIMCDGPNVELEDMPPYIQPSAVPRPPGQYLSDGKKYSEIRSQILEDFNQAIISEALKLEGGNISRAAERLGTAKSNVLRLMKKFEMAVKNPDLD